VIRAVVRAAAPLALVALLAGLALADRDHLVHKVQKGDTLGLLAAEYYGDRRQAVFIMDANNIKHSRELKPGERLRIPMSRKVTTEVGDTFAELAQTHLGDARRGRYLAEFNRMSPDETLGAGRELTIPFHAIHTAAGDETVASIAAARFGDSKNAALLRGYNFLERDVIHAGERLIIPIIDLEVRASALPPDAESKARRERRENMAKEAEAARVRAQAAWRRGDYAGVKKALFELDLDFLDADLAAKVGLLLGSAYVSLGDEDSALTTFRRVLVRQPKTTVNAYWYSPRIRAVWAEAGGAVEGG